MTTHVHVGFEVHTGAPVEVPIGHMMVSGQTQAAGKTTALEAMVARSGLPAVAFVTKRHESSFRAKHHHIAPYFRERADWQTVSSILEATLRERMRFERAWVMRACKGAKTLADVQRNVRRLMDKAKGLSADVYMTLDNYLALVVPQIDRLPYTDTLELSPGLNVMDLSAYSTELAALVIRSVLEWIYTNGDGVLAIIPEAWEMLPQSRGSPVLLAAETLIRKGGAGRNFVWLDSQDLAAVNKNVLRSVSVYLLGVQREANEVRRALAHIPGKRPSVDDVMTLELGQFIVCHGRTVTRCYVQPNWMDTPSAIDIATGRARIIDKHPPTAATWPIHPAPTPLPPPSREDSPVNQKEADALMTENNELRARVRTLETEIREMLGTSVPHDEAPPTRPAPPPAAKQSATFNGVDIDALYELVKARAAADPGDAKLLAILRTVPTLEVTKRQERITVDYSTQQGILAALIAEGFFADPVKPAAVKVELTSRGRSIHDANLSRGLARLCEQGFLRKEAGGTYQAVPGMRVHIVESEAA